MAGVDLSNPGIQQALRDTFSDPSYKTALGMSVGLGDAWSPANPAATSAQAAQDYTVPQKGWDQFRWNWNSRFPSFQIGAEFAQAPTAQGAQSWLKRYQPFGGNVSAWV